MIEELWKEYNNTRSDSIRDKLIIACLPFVKSTAYRLSAHANQSQDMDDLVSAGIIGIMDAIKKYDPSKGASFRNYAQHRIRGAIIDEIRSMDWVPYSVREKARSIEKIYAEFEKSGNIIPDENDISEAMGISLEQYHKALQEISRMSISLLDDILHDADDIESQDSMSTEKELMHKEMENIIGEAIENLPEKERLVITLYYYEEMTMKEIGKVINVSESRVCQVHSSAILRLHTRLKFTNYSDSSF